MDTALTAIPVAKLAINPYTGPANGMHMIRSLIPFDLIIVRYVSRVVPVWETFSLRRLTNLSASLRDIFTYMPIS